MRKVAILLVMVVVGMVQPGASLAENPMGAIKQVKQLPISGVNIVESDKGTFFVSANGRFVFKGPIFDMWNGKPVNSMEDIETVANRIDLKKVGVNLDQLSAFSLGKGQQEEVIFLSPECPHCHNVLQQAFKLKDSYTFRLVLFPLGPKALAQCKKVWCAGPEKGLAALLEQKYDGLAEGNCDISPMQKTLVVARVLGLPVVPYLIRHDGKTHRGGIKDLAGWLSEKL